MPIRLDELKAKSQTRRLSDIRGETKQEKPPGFFGGVKKAAKERGTEFISRFTDTSITPVEGAVRAVGDIAGLAGDVGFEGLKAVTPEFIEKPIKAGFEKALSTAPAQKAIGAVQELAEEHPRAAENIEALINVGSILPAVKGAQIGVKGVQSGAKKVVGGVTKGISAIKPGVSKVAGKAPEALEGVSKVGISKLSGLEKDTIETIIRNPNALTNAQVDSMTRINLANDVKTAVDSDLKALSGLGEEFSNIRNKSNLIAVKDDFVKNILEKKFKFIVDNNGKINATTEAVTRTSSDIKSIQDFFDVWGNETILTNAEFLNMRRDLSELAKFDKISGKTKESETIAKTLRFELNKHREQITGLEKLDSQFAPQIELLNKIKKDIINTQTGELKDNAFSKIANLTGRGKENVLNRLERIIPDIRENVNILKALEDIEANKGVKVGTYLTGAAGGFVLSGGNALGAFIAMIATTPQVMVPILKAYGRLKRFVPGIIDDIIRKIKSGKKLSDKDKKVVQNAILNITEKGKQK